MKKGKTLKDYMRKQSMKTLKSLKEIYKDKIFEQAMNGEENDDEKKILEAVEFEIMVRGLKKVTKQLNKINPFEDEPKT